MFPASTFLSLPLTDFIQGMNFDNMWSVKHNHSDIIFWEIALPVLAFCIPLFLWGDIMRVAHYLKKRWLARKIKKASYIMSRVCVQLLIYLSECYTGWEVG